MRSISRLIFVVAALSASTLHAPVLRAQSARSDEVRRFVKVGTPVIALTHVRVIDGTGAPARADQTVVLDHGIIRDVGPASSTVVPPAATVLDLHGRSVMPGYVMLHEHLFYPSGDGSTYTDQPFSFPRLYLAGGTTTIRTAGSMEGYTDLNIARAIDAGAAIGPHIDVSAPYLEGRGLRLSQVKALTSPDDARRMVAYWADEGATSFKAYAHITRAELAAAIKETHRRGLKITAHLCSVTYHEAIQLGIDNLEHGIHDATDFVIGKRPDECPPDSVPSRSIATLDVASAPVRSLIRELVDHHVAVTSTLVNGEALTPNRPPIPVAALDAMVSYARAQYLERRAALDADPNAMWARMFPKELQFTLAFFRAGGLLLAGTDPEGFGGIIPGYANQRTIELLVEAGLTPLEAIRVSTLNGATYLGRADRIGSITVGKNADLIVVAGDPSTNVTDVERVELVFKDGVGFDSPALFASAKGRVGSQ